MGERWDRDRFMLERERNRDQGAGGGRFEEDRYFMRGGRGGGREHSVDERRFNRGFDDDDTVRDRRWYGDEPRRRETMEPERPRPPVMERERDFPPRRPGFLRRQSSLDTFDRRPRIFDPRDEYGPPARREDYRAPAYTPIPLPKTRALPPSRRFYDGIKVAEPNYYGDDDYHPYDDHIREQEYTRTRRRRSRSRSRDSFSTRTRSHRSSSVSSSSSRSSSSSGGTTVRSEYPKKGKTRIPAKLVSKRALIDLGYPFFEEGNTIIVKKALGQDNIDELLKVSEDYKKVEAEIAASRKPTQALPAPEPKPAKSTTGAPKDDKQAPTDAPKEPKEPKEPKAVPVPPQQPKQPPPQQAPPQQAPPVQPVPPPQRDFPPPPPPVNHVPRQPPPPMQMPPAAPPVIYQAPHPMYPPAPYEVVDETYIRDVSPDRSSSTSSWDTRSTHSTHRRRRKSAGPVVLAGRSRSRSRSGREIRAEIKALERELAHRPRGGGSREIVQAERLPSGEVVIYEDRVEKEVLHHKPPRLEKDKKGRMSISVPKIR